MIPRNTQAGGNLKVVLGICVFLAVMTWIVFGQTLGHEFINYDDPDYVVKNSEVTKGLTLRGMAWAFTHIHSANWHPLTTMNHMLDCQLYGLKAGAHHCTNVVLHTVAVLLLFLVLRQMTGALWRSAFVAALFAVHPLRVESVAWISERKDVLSAVFFMLTLGLYVRYVRYSSVGRYLAVVGSFALGLMCKPTLVTVPFILLLLDYWPLKRFAGESSTRRLILEKIPLFALSAAGAGVTLWAHEKSITQIEHLPFMWRVGNGLVTCLTYIKQMIWPARLAVFYPHPANTLPVWEIGLAIVLLLLATAAAITLRRKRPYFFTGWFWYLLMLLPVIGLIQVGSQGHADRYTYLSQIGLYMLLAWAITDALASRLQRRILGVTASVAIIVLAWCAHIQASYWHNGESLWSHAIAVTSENCIAHDGLGQFLLDHGRLDEAIDQFQIALNITPKDPTARTNLGIALTKKGRIDEAIAYFQRVLEDYPNDAKAHANLGTA